MPQDKDIFIPVKPDFCRDEFQRKLEEVGFVMSKTHYWDWYNVGNCCFEVQSETGPQEWGETTGLPVLRIDEYDFIAVPIGDNGDIAAWMRQMQPLPQQGLLTDGEKLYNWAPSIALPQEGGKAILDLSKVQSYKHLQELRNRGSRMVQNQAENQWNSNWKKCLETDIFEFIGALRADIVLELVLQQQKEAVEEEQMRVKGLAALEKLNLPSSESSSETLSETPSETSKPPSSLLRKIFQF